MTETRYIVIWRRNENARYLDVQLDPQTDEIAVFTDAKDLADRANVVTDEADLVEFINGTDTRTRRVEAQLAHRVLGWDIP